MVPSELPVCVVISIDPTIDTDVVALVPVRVPVASANRPVPPVIVVTPSVRIGVPKVPVPETLVNSLSPLAATIVPVPVQLNPFEPTRTYWSSVLLVNFPRREA